MEQTSAPLFSAFMQDLAKQLVPLVVAELKAQTQAEGMGMIALDPDNIALPVYTLMRHDDNVRDILKDIIEDQYGHDLRSIGTKLDELDNKVDDIDIDDIKGEIATLEEKVGELEENRGTEVDADNSDFQDAVRSVIRNHI